MIKDSAKEKPKTQQTTANPIQVESIFKTKFSTEKQEQPVYLVPPILDYPEDDQNQFYIPSNFPYILFTSSNDMCLWYGQSNQQTIYFCEPANRTDYQM